MFTSSIKSKSFFNGDFKVEVEFTDGVQKWIETFSVRSSEDLKSRVKSRLQVLNELEILSQTLPIGVYDTSDTTTIPPTQEVLDKDKWFRNFNKLDRLTTLNNLGALRPGLVADLDALRVTVSADFKKAYIADM